MINHRLFNSHFKKYRPKYHKYLSALSCHFERTDFDTDSYETFRQIKDAFELRFSQSQYGLLSYLPV